MPWPRLIGQGSQFLKTANSTSELSPGGTAIHPETPSTNKEMERATDCCLPPVPAQPICAEHYSGTSLETAWAPHTHSSLGPSLPRIRRPGGGEGQTGAHGQWSCWQLLLKPSPYFPLLRRGGRNSMSAEAGADHPSPSYSHGNLQLCSLGTTGSQLLLWKWWGGIRGFHLQLMNLPELTKPPPLNPH